MAPTRQYCRSKAHKITDDTAAQGCDVVVPLNAKFQQPIDQDLKHFPALGAFPHRQNYRLDPDAALSQGIRQPGKLRYSHIFVRNNDEASVPHKAADVNRCVPHGAFGHSYVLAQLTQPHTHYRHHSIAFMNLSTLASCTVALLCI